jgi:hypothetical protein
MKFDNLLSVGWVTGSCIGVILSEICFHPPMINHLWTGNAMLLMAIIVGLVSGDRT